MTPPNDPEDERRLARADDRPPDSLPSRGAGLADVQTHASWFQRYGEMHDHAGPEGEAAKARWEVLAGEFYDRYRPAFYRTLRRRGLDRETADELSHELTADLLHGLKTRRFGYDPEKKGLFRGYLWKALRRAMARSWGRLPKGSSKAVEADVKAEFGAWALGIRAQVERRPLGDVAREQAVREEMVADLVGLVDRLIEQEQDRNGDIARPMCERLAMKELGQLGWEIRLDFRTRDVHREASERGIPASRVIAERHGLHPGTVDWIAEAVERMHRDRARSYREGCRLIDDIDSMTFAVAQDASPEDYLQELAQETAIDIDHLRGFYDCEVDETMTPKEYAEARGEAVGTVYKRHQRIRQKLEDVFRAAQGRRD